jgi:Bifunctional DNA primase/polymerase, N-terminal
MSGPLTAALALARRGLAVLPVRGKLPSGHHGVDDASSDPDRIRELFEQRTSATDHLPPDGVAVACGRPLPDGGFLTKIDVDPRHGGDASLAELAATHGTLPVTWTTRTRSGGTHYDLRTPGPVRCRIGFRPGLDNRGASGYGVAWGPGYSIAARHPIANCPAWLLTILLPPAPALPPARPVVTARHYVERAIELECGELAGAPEGTRNSRLNRAAYSLARFAADGQADAGDLVQLLACAASRAGLPEREITRTVQSAFRARGVSL